MHHFFKEKTTSYSVFFFVWFCFLELENPWISSNCWFHFFRCSQVQLGNAEFSATGYAHCLCILIQHNVLDVDNLQAQSFHSFSLSSVVLSELK